MVKIESARGRIALVTDREGMRQQMSANGIDTNSGEIPAGNASREAWVRWLVGVLASRWPQAKLRAVIEGMQSPGGRRGIVPDIEFWYPNDDGVYALRYLYTVMPTDRIG